MERLGYLRNPSRRQVADDLVVDRTLFGDSSFPAEFLCQCFIVQSLSETYNELPTLCGRKKSVARPPSSCAMCAYLFPAEM